MARTRVFLQKIESKMRKEVLTEVYLWNFWNLLIYVDHCSKALFHLIHQTSPFQSSFHLTHPNISFQRSFHLTRLTSTFENSFHQFASIFTTIFPLSLHSNIQSLLDITIKSWTPLQMIHTMLKWWFNEWWMDPGLSSALIMN